MPSRPSPAATTSGRRSRPRFREAFEVCTEGYAEATCPFSAVDAIAGVRGGLAYDAFVSDCVVGGDTRPWMQDVEQSVVINAATEPASCMDTFAVQLRVVDGLITEVTLLRGGA